MTKTHLVIKTNKPASNVADQKTLLDLRAARFKTTNGPIGSAAPGSSKPTSAPTNPEDAAKLAARAARFADVQAAPAITTTGKVSIGSSSNVTPSAVEDAEKLAKRAARFANIPK